MKTAVLITRILLGLIFVVFGLNGFFLFINPPSRSHLGRGAAVSRRGYEK